MSHFGLSFLGVVLFVFWDVWSIVIYLSRLQQVSRLVLMWVLCHPLSYIPFRCILTARDFWSKFTKPESSSSVSSKLLPPWSSSFRCKRTGVIGSSSFHAAETHPVTSNKFTFFNLWIKSWPPSIATRSEERSLCFWLQLQLFDLLFDRVTSH